MLGRFSHHQSHLNLKGNFQVFHFFVAPLLPLRDPKVAERLLAQTTPPPERLKEKVLFVTARS